MENNQNKNTSQTSFLRKEALEKHKDRDVTNIKHRHSTKKQSALETTRPGVQGDICAKVRSHGGRAVANIDSVGRKISQVRGSAASLRIPTRLDKNVKDCNKSEWWSHQQRGYNDYAKHQQNLQRRGTWSAKSRSQRSHIRSCLVLTLPGMEGYYRIINNQRKGSIKLDQDGYRKPRIERLYSQNQKTQQSMGQIISSFLWGREDQRRTTFNKKQNSLIYNIEPRYSRSTSFRTPHNFLLL